MIRHESDSVHNVVPIKRKSFKKVDDKLFVEPSPTPSKIATYINKPNVNDISEWHINIELLTDNVSNEIIIEFDNHYYVLEETDFDTSGKCSVKINFEVDHDNVFLGVSVVGSGSMTISNCYVSHTLLPTISNLDYFVVQDMSLEGSINEQVDYFIVQDMLLNGSVNEQVDYFVVQDINTNNINSEHLHYFVAQDIIRLSQ